MGSVKAQDEEQDFYRDVIRRAKRLRERAAESLKRSRESRKRQPAAKPKEQRPKR